MHTITKHGLIANMEDLLKSRFAARHINLGQSRTTTHPSATNHLSSLKGRGMDFAEVRSYQAGDDIRHMDWRVTARTNKPHLKTYQEERERPVFFVLDYTSSMHFGTRRTYKSVMAANVFAHLAWAAHYHKDRVGGIIFSNDHHTEIKPSNRQPSIIHLLKHLSNPQYLEKTNADSNAFLTALQRIQRIARSGSLVFILSDFAKASDSIKHEIKKINQHCHVCNLFFYDPIEVSVPKKQPYTFSDGIAKMRINLTKPAAIKTYESLFLARQQWLTTLHKTQNISFIPFSTEAVILQTLQRALRFRRGH